MATSKPGRKSASPEQRRNPHATALRTTTCGELTAADVGSDVILTGWVNRRRDHGKLIFIDLRDRFGLTQLVIDPERAETGEAVLSLASETRVEYVLRVQGKVARRLPGTENASLPTGEIEIIVAQIELLNPSKSLPFPVAESNLTVDESLRMRYRYLDIRRTPMRSRLELRHQTMLFMRNFLDARGFVEVETPILTKSTPEGARDYLVPSRVWPGEFYALPQAPQQFKQLLMVAGMDRYFQIARCFRDEDLRGDRQPEFTQLDLEMSFVEEADVMGLVEELVTTLIETALDQTDPAETIPPHRIRGCHRALWHRSARYALRTSATHPDRGTRDTGRIQSLQGRHCIRWHRQGVAHPRYGDRDAQRDR